MIGRGGGNGNRGIIAKVSGGGKTGETLDVKNSLTVLKDQCTEDTVKKTDETTLSSGKKGKIVVVGDSQVRGLGRLFCAKDSERRLCVFLSEAGIGEVSDRLEDVLAGKVTLQQLLSAQGGMI